MLTKVLAGGLALAILACSFLFWRNGVNAEARAVAEASLKTVIADNGALSKSLTDSNDRHIAELAARDAKVAEQSEAAAASLAIAQTADRKSVVWRDKFNDLSRSAPDACWLAPLPDRLFTDGVRDIDNR